MLCVALLFVIVAMRKVSQPESWNWLIPPENADGPVAAEEDQVVITLEGKPTDEASGASDGKQSLSTELSPLLNEEDKKQITDDYLGLKQEEQALFQRVVTQLADTDRGVLQLNANREGAYQVWMAETDVWRGELIEFEANAKRIVSRAAEEGESNRRYDLWVTTSGSGAMPLHVVTAGLPVDCPTGESLDVPLRIIGTVYKREGYSAQGGLRTTLMIAAAPPTLISGAAPHPTQNIVPLMMAMSLILSMFILYSLWKTFQTAFKPATVRPLRFDNDDETDPDFSRLEGVEVDIDVTGEPVIQPPIDDHEEAPPRDS